MEAATNDSAASPRETRRHAGLLGFLLKAELDAMLRQNPIQLAEQSAGSTDQWRSCVEARNRLPALEGGQLLELPAGLIPAAERVRMRTEFARHYESFADYEFALAPINALLSPQWSADLDYVEELAARLPRELSEEDAFDFCMPEGHITEPIRSGNSVVFSSPRPDLIASPVPEVRRLDGGDYEVVIRASSRPNLLQVAVLDGRLILTNGVHKVLALHARGVASVPCVMRTVSSIEHVGFPAPLSMFSAAVVEGPRPALLIDFLADAISAPMLVASTLQVMRISIGVDALTIPTPSLS